MQLSGNVFTHRKINALLQKSLNLLVGKCKSLQDSFVLFCGPFYCSHEEIKHVSIFIFYLEQV